MLRQSNYVVCKQADRFTVTPDLIRGPADGGGQRWTPGQARGDEESYLFVIDTIAFDMALLSEVEGLSTNRLWEI